MEQVDVIRGGLAMLTVEDFENTKIKNLRLMNNNIRGIASKTFR